MLVRLTTWLSQRSKGLWLGLVCLVLSWRHAFGLMLKPWCSSWPFHILRLAGIMFINYQRLSMHASHLPRVSLQVLCCVQSSASSLSLSLQES